MLPEQQLQLGQSIVFFHNLSSICVWFRIYITKFIIFMILKHISVALSIFTLLCDQHHHPSLKRLFSLCKAQRSELNSNVEMPHPYIFHIFEGGVNVCNCSHELLPICCHSQGKQIQRLSVGSLYNNDVVWTECIPPFIGGEALIPL